MDDPCSSILAYYLLSTTMDESTYRGAVIEFARSYTLWSIGMKSDSIFVSEDITFEYLIRVMDRPEMEEGGCLSHLWKYFGESTTGIALFASRYEIS